MVYLILILIFMIIVIIIKYIKFDKSIKNFEKDYNEFKLSKYICNKDLEKIKNDWNSAYLCMKDVPKLLKRINWFIKEYERLDELVDQINEEYFRNEKELNKDIFENIDGKVLDDDQIKAIIIPEDNVLVAAGAGSGKTLTIVGKVHYLCKKLNINPDDILLIAFERKAAAEMTERITKSLGKEIKAMTFHKLGLNIIVDASTKRPDIVEENILRNFVSEYFSTNINDIDYIKLLIHYFAYYINIPDNIDEFESLGEMYEYQKSRDFETIKSRYNKNKYIEKVENESINDKITIKQEYVKSFEELQIANFLFLNGINYEYEAEYIFQNNDKQHKIYRPDFYLTDYDIYLEHFGINEDGRLPQLSKIEEQKYLEEIEWKRMIHKENGTKLLETYSYYSSKGILLDKLEEILKDNDIEFKEIDYNEIFNATYKSKGDTYFSEFIKLCVTFINLFKSNNYKVDNIFDLNYPENKYNNNFYKKRRELFLKIIKPIIIGYNKYLENNNSIDFNDMINKATDLVNSNYSIHKYKYIIIDEYQDISSSRYNLIKAIIEKTNAKLFAVGDDFQSIFRFSGSDISYFEHFDKYFTNTKLVKIKNTYRNSQELIDEAGNFIMKNPNQVAKQLKSNISIEKPICFYLYDTNPFIILKKMIDDLIEEFGETKNIMLLGRTHYDEKLIEQSDFLKLSNSKVYYKNNPRVSIEFSTVHSAKGLESDNVIILNFENSILGFPNKISDDPILTLVLNIAEQFRYAEERRLFYVALTRTKNKTLILTSKNTPSEFFREFIDSDKIKIIYINSEKVKMVLCPRCETGRLIVRKNERTNNYFLGCTNYPSCTYTLNRVSVLENPKKCINCGGYLIEKYGKQKVFLGCTNYPRCNYMEDAICPQCGNNLIVRRGINGEFVGCSSYPNCTFTKKVENE